MESSSMPQGGGLRKPRPGHRGTLGADAGGFCRDTDRAVMAAWCAFAEGPWPALTASARGRLLYRLADLVARDAGILAELETRDTGKVIRETRAVVAYVAEYYRYFAGLADKIEGSVLPIDKPDLEVYTRREPLGVVAAIVPWNNQLFLSAAKVGPALAAGNTVVLKASEDGPAPLLHFAKLIDEAGFPKGVVNVITGFGNDCGATLTSHSPGVARRLHRRAGDGAPRGAQHRRELRRHHPRAWRQVAESSSSVMPTSTRPPRASSPVSSGRPASPASPARGCWSRRGWLMRFIARLGERARAIRIGPPLDPATEMGPLATRRQRERIGAIVSESIDQGATLVTGGRAPSAFSDGFYYEPTVIAAPSQDVACVRQELFGPVLTVLTFRDEAEAVRLANDSHYAFAAGVFTTNLARAPSDDRPPALGHRLGQHLPCGLAHRAVRRQPADRPWPRGAASIRSTTTPAPSGLDQHHSDAPLADPFVLR
jgi:aldehyde dehydrogenase (NAD+)/betaine-aldehyde dehydrogenase